MYCFPTLLTILPSVLALECPKVKGTWGDRDYWAPVCTSSSEGDITKHTTVSNECLARKQNLNIDCNYECPCKDCVEKCMRADVKDSSVTDFVCARGDHTKYQQGQTFTRELKIASEDSETALKLNSTSVSCITTPPPKFWFCALTHLVKCLTQRIICLAHLTPPLIT